MYALEGQIEAVPVEHKPGLELEQESIGSVVKVEGRTVHWFQKVRACCVRSRLVEMHSVQVSMKRSGRRLRAD